MSYPQSDEEQLSDPQSPSDSHKLEEALRMVIEEWNSNGDCYGQEGYGQEGQAAATDEELGGEALGEMEHDMGEGGNIRSQAPLPWGPASWGDHGGQYEMPDGAGASMLDMGESDRRRSPRRMAFDTLEERVCRVERDQRRMKMDSAADRERIRVLEELMQVLIASLGAVGQSGTPPVQQQPSHAAAMGNSGGAMMERHAAEAGAAATTAMPRQFVNLADSDVEAEGGKETGGAKGTSKQPKGELPFVVRLWDFHDKRKVAREGGKRPRIVPTMALVEWEDCTLYEWVEWDKLLDGRGSSRLYTLRASLTQGEHKSGTYTGYRLPWEHELPGGFGLPLKAPSHARVTGTQRSRN
jgi:hypothetical protein